MKFTLSTEGWNRRPRLFLLRKGCNGPLLIGSHPTRPCSAFNVLHDDAVFYQVSSKESDAAVHDCFIFFGSTLHSVAGNELREIGARDDNGEVAGTIEYRDALWIWTKRFNPTTVCGDGVVRLKAPSPN